MDKKAVEAFAREAAKSIKTESGAPLTDKEHNQVKEIAKVLTKK